MRVHTHRTNHELTQAHQTHCTPHTTPTSLPLLPHPRTSRFQNHRRHSSPPHHSSPSSSTIPLSSSPLQTSSSSPLSPLSERQIGLPSIGYLVPTQRSRAPCQRSRACRSRARARRPFRARGPPRGTAALTPSCMSLSCTAALTPSCLSLSCLAALTPSPALGPPRCTATLTPSCLSLSCTAVLTPGCTTSPLSGAKCTPSPVHTHKVCLWWRWRLI